MRIRPGDLPDVPVIAELIRGLARYEKLEHEVRTTEEKLTDTLFG
ncbi:MAG: N-acetyltransferase, partial [Chloroflexi bacterium]